MSWVIDRFEEDLAILEELESMQQFICFIKELPKGVKEGDVLIKGGTCFTRDLAKTAERADIIRKKMQRLKKNKQ